MLRKLSLKELEMKVVESLVLEMMDVELEPEVVEMEANSASGLEMVAMEPEKECEDGNKELTRRLLKYRERDGNKELELTTMELEDVYKELVMSTRRLLEYYREGDGDHVV